MSKSKATLSITERLLLDFVKYKTNNNHKFYRTSVIGLHQIQNKQQS